MSSGTVIVIPLEGREHQRGEWHAMPSPLHPKSDNGYELPAIYHDFLSRDFEVVRVS